LNFNYFLSSGNLLDSSAPTKRRGKERELPKKKRPNKLKRIILQDRLKRKELRTHLAEFSKKKIEEMRKTSTEKVEEMMTSVKEEEENVDDSPMEIKTEMSSEPKLDWSSDHEDEKVELTGTTKTTAEATKIPEGATTTPEAVTTFVAAATSTTASHDQELVSAAQQKDSSGSKRRRNKNKKNQEAKIVSDQQTSDKANPAVQVGIKPDVPVDQVMKEILEESPMQKAKRMIHSRKFRE
jgi:hypothetical protein